MSGEWRVFCRPLVSRQKNTFARLSTSDPEAISHISSYSCVKTNYFMVNIHTNVRTSPGYPPLPSLQLTEETFWIKFLRFISWWSQQREGREIRERKLCTQVVLTNFFKMVNGQNLRVSIAMFITVIFILSYTLKMHKICCCFFSLDMFQLAQKARRSS